MLEEIDSSNLLGSIINPLSGYFICNHFIGDELTSTKEDHQRQTRCTSTAGTNDSCASIGKSALGVVYSCSARQLPGVEFDGYNGKIKLPFGINDLLKNNNYDSIKQYDIVLCQVNFFDYFFSKILPKLPVQIILITSQWAYPAIERSEKTDIVLNHPNILLWVSQNPIYANHPKYMPFPYGINMNSLSLYYSFLHEYITNNKSQNIKLLQLTVKDWYPDDHIRKKYPMFGKESGERLSYVSYLREIAKCRYIISPMGDRTDCYRNYEAIGLECIPISNVGSAFKEILGDNMIYSDAKSMIGMLNTKHIERNYTLPNRRIILLEYWTQQIIDKIKKLT